KLRFYLFQAEDGIRYRNVTGVQTCALPIWVRSWIWARSPVAARVMMVVESRKAPSSLAAGPSWPPGPFHQDTSAAMYSGEPSAGVMKYGCLRVPFASRTHS